MYQKPQGLGTKADAIYRSLGANERAIVDKIGNPFLRKIFIRVINIKMRLQFSGWLQYVLPMPFFFVLLLLSGIFALFGVTVVALIFAGLAGLLLLSTILDIVTVKFRIRFPERRPKRRDNLDLFDLMRFRRSCRSFQTRNLIGEDLEALMNSLHRRDGEVKLGTAPVRFEYIRAPLTVWPTVNGREFIVAIAPKEYNRRAVMDVGRTLQKVVMDATRLGLSTCWIGPGADHRSLIQELGERYDESEDNMICIVAVGYASRYIPLFLRIFNAQFSRRLPLEQLFFSDPGMQNPLTLDSPSNARFGRIFEICQWAPSSYNGQTTRCVAINNPTRFDFYASTASRYYAAVAVGIWCANWELGCQELGIKGHWEILSNIPDPNGVPKYDISWVGE